MSRGLTPQQERAARAPGPVAIIAGAGTGKTLTMVQRYLQLLDRGFAPAEIVAVTFTRAAAAELRSRVRLELQAGRGNRLVGTLEAAPIWTFDALCRHLALAYPWAHELGPHIDTLDPRLADVATLIERDALLAAALESSRPPISLALLEALAEAAGRRPRPLLAALSRHPDEVRERHIELARAWWSDLAQRLEQAVASARATTDPQRRLLAAAERLVVHIHEHWQRPSPAGTEPLRAAVLAIETRAGAGVTAVAEILREAKHALSPAGGVDWRALGWTRADEAVSMHHESILEIAQRLVSLARADRAAQGVATFADLEDAALAVLDDLPARQELRNRWRALIVDEYQDVSPAQVAIVERLTELVGGETAVVGDPKQAIYAFRGARPDLALAFAERSQRAELTSSFRSVPEILDLANAYAARALGAHESLVATRPRSLTIEPVVVIAAPAAGAVADRRRRAAHEVAAHLAALLASGVSIDRGGGSRPIAPGDIAIVARRWAELEDYRRELAALGIATLAQGGGNLLDTPSAAFALALLRWAADPSDDLATIALARHEAIGFGDDELALLAPRAREVGWRVALAELADPRSARLDALEHAIEGRSAVEALRSVRVLLELDALAELGPDAKRRTADQDAVEEFLADLALGRSAAAVAALVADLRAAGTPVPRPPLSADDAVTLTTIHGAKGLEWSVVVAVGLESRGGARQAEGLVFHDDHGLAWHDRSAGEERSSLAAAIAEALEEESRAEARRLTYVALTRARDHLCIVLDDPHDAAGDDEALRACLAEHPCIRWIELERETAEEPAQLEDQGASHPQGHQSSADDIPPPPLEPLPPWAPSAGESSRAGEAPLELSSVAALAAWLECPTLARWVGPTGASALGAVPAHELTIPPDIARLAGVDSLTPRPRRVTLLGRPLEVVTLAATERLVVIPARALHRAAPEWRRTAGLAALALRASAGAVLDLDAMELSIVDATPSWLEPRDAHPCATCRFARRCPWARGPHSAAQTRTTLGTMA